MQTLKNNRPIENALCVFKRKKNNIYILGYISNGGIKLYGRRETISIDEFDAYEYIDNENDGFIFVEQKK
jgi:hypothetical protein